MFIRFILLIFSLLVVSPCFSSVILFSDDFESGDGSIIFRYLKAHGHDAIVIPKKGTNQSNGLEVQYDSLYKGSVRVKGFFKLAKKVKEASLTYDVFFNDDFQFVLGGKMHGLGPDEVITGDWPSQPNGWSSRVIFGKSGKVEVNLYLQNQNAKWGESRDNESFRFEKGKFYAITLYTRLNSGPNKKDGEARIYINGKLMVEFKNAHFWKGTEKESLISQFLFSTFHGGGTQEWAPQDKTGKFVNVHATFDNFVVYEGLQIKEKPGL